MNENHQVDRPTEASGFAFPITPSLIACLVGAGYLLYEALENLQAQALLQGTLAAIGCIGVLLTTKQVTKLWRMVYKLDLQLTKLRDTSHVNDHRSPNE